MTGDVPAFARDFPDDAELAALVRAFEEGDYGRVRVEAPKLAARTTDADVKRAAGVLRSRIEADPLAKGLLLLTLALLVGLATFWIMRDRTAEHVVPNTAPPVIERIESPRAPRPAGS